MQAKRFVLITFVVFLAASLACSLSAPTPVAWVGTPSAVARAKTQTAFTNTQMAERTAMPTLPPTRTPTQPQITTTPTPVIAEDGPWLIYPGRDGRSLIALDRDTGTQIPLALPGLINLSDLEAGLSPDGKKLLLRAGTLDVVNEMGLYLLENPHEEIIQVSPLLSVFLERQVINKDGDRASQASLAVTADGGIAWSPDGSLVAFTAALEGDSGDIYLFDLIRDNVKRMTVRYRQNLTPFWSRDMNWMVFQEAENISEEGAWEITAVSNVSIPNYDITRFLYLPPEGGQGEVFVGWLNEVSFLSYTRGVENHQQLRVVFMERTSPSLVFGGYFTELAFDPNSTNLAVAVDALAGQLNGMSPGIYLSVPDQTDFWQVLTGQYTGLHWSPEGNTFLVAGAQGIFGVRLDGTIFTLPNEAQVSVSPNNNWLVAWNNDGLKAGVRLYTPDGSLLQVIGNMAVRQVIWQAGSRGFYLVSEDGLYQVRFPLLEPVLISEDIYQGDDFRAVWLGSD